MIIFLTTNVVTLVSKMWLGIEPRMLEYETEMLLGYIRLVLTTVIIVNYNVYFKNTWVTNLRT